MTSVAILTGGTPSFIPKVYDYYVGVDRGAFRLLKEHYPLHLAIGDFDSVTPAELDYLKSKAKFLVQAPKEKDDTDTEVALREVFSRHPEAQVTVYGAFGGRIDHFLSNVFLPSHPELRDFMRQIRLCDSCNLLRYYPAGTHTIFPSCDKDYLAFVVEGDGKLTICGAKYELKDHNYFSQKVYTSNEFINQPVTFTLDKGYVIVIETRDWR
ncbi:thiamine diphosphokinase [Streptococcus sciuri]|uniref:Thiamine diphosphokinase n=1 Tax=Streptococcus sciuri TaxID=2973939 RepID=A0ABT2F939_9STRE|nr:thiamine diphosphokinase [Streptococcus sciuri]MCS4488939.1 thiamine diphosphokinase [Streptococcus sciuri]